ncbi:MAG: 3-isopropylmalate dehydratase large subunit [Candidatus Latescibacterota bacterium]|nr:3-isopropylmalate dehydratase large subunit [Candidatus Latescibacterota bacterium]
MGKNLFESVWEQHTVRELPSGQTQLFVGLHLIHEVTSPQAFQMLRERGLKVMHPDRTFATVDHIVPTDIRDRPFLDDLAEKMMVAIEWNTKEFELPFYGVGDPRQGVVHVIGPELGLTQPGMTIVCGDSHTATHGAFGAIAFGIGTSQVRDALATQCLSMSKTKVRRIEVRGSLKEGVYAKDVILAIIGQLGVKGGMGYAYEYGGDVIDAMSMEERMTVCNMSIEGGARCGYVNPDDTTFEYLEGRPHAPRGDDFAMATQWWSSLASGEDASYDDVVSLDGFAIAPTVTWGITPGQSCAVDECTPKLDTVPDSDRTGVAEALEYMGFAEEQPVVGTEIDVAFIGSCTNSRISDLREAAKVAKSRKVREGVKALVVPGSVQVREQAQKEGLHEVFQEAGFEWREAGCSMCLAMNPDKLRGDQICASTSNRNFKGRQGSPTGRTLLMSPAMVAAAAVTGSITDVRKLMN